MEPFKIALFGAGSSGVAMFAETEPHVVCFIDNNHDKQGRSLCGKPIISLRQLREFDVEAIVIASVFQAEIENQLIENGYGDLLAVYQKPPESPFNSTAGGDLIFTYGQARKKPRLRTMHLPLTGACNLRCRTCIEEGKHFKAIALTRAQLEDLVKDSFDKITHLRLDSIGEPTLSPHFEYVLSEASKRNISVFISTNGTLLTQARAELIVSSTVHFMQISFDSPDPKTNEFIRKGIDHNEVMNSAHNLVEARHKAKQKYPEIHFHAAVWKQNIYQLSDLVRLANRLGLDGVTIAYGHVHSFMDPEWSVYFNRQLCNDKVQEARELASELGIFFNAPDPFFSSQLAGPVDNYCEYLHSWTFVAETGDVYPCCVSGRDYPLGNVKEQKLSDIWVGNRYKALRNTYYTEQPVLKKCGHCHLINGWNADDYKVHFAKNHWAFVEQKISKNSSSYLICSSGL